MDSRDAYLFTLGRSVARIQRGWTQGAYSRMPDGRALSRGLGTPAHTWAVDIVGALTQEARGQELSEDDVENLRLIVTAALPFPYRVDEMFGLERFNDKTGTTIIAVVSVLVTARGQYERATS